MLWHNINRSDQYMRERN